MDSPDLPLKELESSIRCRGERELDSTLLPASQQVAEAMHGAMENRTKKTNSDDQLGLSYCCIGKVKDSCVDVLPRCPATYDIFYFYLKPSWTLSEWKGE